MRPFDKDVICEAFETIELTIETLLLEAYNIENGREIDAENLTSLTPRLQYLKSILADEIDYMKKQGELKP